MTPAQFDANEPEIKQWLRTGAIDGAEPPPLAKPSDHVFTRAEIAAMTVEEFEANELAIRAQASTMKKRERRSTTPNGR
jgi:hypothetical protein